MFFRFGSALALVGLISLAGTALEKRNPELKRAVSRQHYRLGILLEQHAANRVLAQQLGAPGRLVNKLDAETAESAAPVKSPKPKRPEPRPARYKSHAPSARSP